MVARPAIVRGALFGLAVIAPVSIAVEVLDAMGVLQKGLVVFIPTLAVMAAFGLAGYQAAKRASESPYTHGALAGLAAFSAWLVLRVVTHVLLGEPALGKEGDTTMTVAFTVATVALLAVSFGILGGLVASSRNRPGGGRR